MSAIGIVVDDNGIQIGMIRDNGNGTYRAHQAMTEPDVIAHWTTLEGAASVCVR
jgi:hypothetical protein